MSTFTTTTPPDDPGTGMLPPQDLAAEQSVLGGMLLSPTVIGEVTDIVTDRDFYRPAHTAIFAAILALYSSGEPADAVTVADELDRRGDLTRIGAAPYLHTLIATVPTPANATYYARIVADKATLRRLVETGTRIAQLGQHGITGADIPDIIDRAQAALFDATTATTLAAGAMASADAAAAVLADLADDTPRDLVHTGLTDLDDVLGGLEPGEFTVVCGRPGHGKTLAGLQIARHAALAQGKHVLILSLEMSHQLITQRMLSAIPVRGVELNKIRRKPGWHLTDHDWAQLVHAQHKLANTRLWIDDTSSQTITTIRTSLRRHIQQHGPLDLVVIDYLGLIESDRHHETRNHEISRITRDLKNLSRDLNLATVLLHQLNRQPTQRADKRPQLSDLRDSGAVEQDAFAVIAIHTPYVDDRDDPQGGESTLSILKNRQGNTGTITVAWQGHIARVSDLSLA